MPSSESNANNELSTKLETALVRELFAVWKQINASYFGDALVAPTIELTRTQSVLGRWSHATRTLEISRPLLLSQPWGIVVEVLKHEMAHQYVSEVLGASDETPHGPAFRETCRRHGIDAKATGMPKAPDGSGGTGSWGETFADDREARIVERIARLLALAESPNVHEAEAATLAAQRLMLKYNLESRGGIPRDYGFRHVGKPSGRVGESDRILAMLLGRFFFVEVIWVPVYRPAEGKRGSVLEICGTPSNLAIAEYVHAFLTHTSERLWEEHRRNYAIRSNRDRRTFLSGVMAGFADKLARESTAHKEEGLVWVKDGDLHGYFRRRHPYVRNVRYTGTRKNESFTHGREAGRRIVLRRGVEAAPSSSSSKLSGRAVGLLPPKAR
ncbi:DUF2786 domain-containing protein [Pendulispora brunnea]|uniref:DUF2786 domain-containing protein n=1 Tax=Pendulispora brunnea TaxID=2905690 RepID=A0ABZ2KL04_9BACT